MLIGDMKKHLCALCYNEQHPMWRKALSMGLATYKRSAVSGKTRKPGLPLTQGHCQRTSSVMIWFCPHFYFLFPLPFFSHMTLCHLIGHLTFVTWLDDHLTFLSHDHLYCAYFLLSYSPLSAIYGDAIVSGPIVLLSIVLPCYCLRPIVPQSPIVCLVRTLSHGSCLSSI